MRTDPKIRAVEICLQHIQAGASLEKVLELYPYWAPELRPILEAAMAASSLAKSLDRETDSARFHAARQGSREKFLEAGERLRRPEPRVRFTPALRYALLTLALVLTVAFGALRTLAASAEALPGDTLYSLKLATQRTQVLITMDARRRLELEQSIEQRRATDVRALIERLNEPTYRPKTLTVDFSGVLQDMRPGQWVVDDILVKVPAEAHILGQIQQGIYIQVQGVLTPEGELIAQRLQSRLFEISGGLQEVFPDAWLVNGIRIERGPETILRNVIGDQPLPGSRVRVVAYLLADRRLQARLLEVITPGAATNNTPLPFQWGAPTETPNQSPTPISLETAVPSLQKFWPKGTPEPEGSSEPAHGSPDPRESAEPGNDEGRPRGGF